MKLRDFTLTTNELPPTNVYVLGYWEGEPAPFAVTHHDGDGWYVYAADLSAPASSCGRWYSEYTTPTSWSHLSGGTDLNRADFHGKFEIDLDAEV